MVTQAKKLNINTRGLKNFLAVIYKALFKTLSVRFSVKNKQTAMYTEIHQQPEIISAILKRHLPQEAPVTGFDFDRDILLNISNIYIVASGSSRNIGGIARYFIEKTAKIPTFVEYASEFAHKNVNLKQNDLVIGISQSGETADTYQALKLAKDKGAITVALTNNVNSKIHTLADYKIYVGAGAEKSVAATKSFTAQLLLMYILGIYLAENNSSTSKEELDGFKKELFEVSKNLSLIFRQESEIEKVAKNIQKAKSLVILGRGVSSAVAKEGALKIKETCYIDANGYPSGEFLHGHMAFIDKKVPVISIICKSLGCKSANSDENYGLAFANTLEIKKKRNPELIIIKNYSDKEIQSDKLLAKSVFLDIPDCSEEISPFYTAVLLQLLALKTAERLKRNVDNPRNLQKAVIRE